MKKRTKLFIFAYMCSLIFVMNLRVENSYHNTIFNNGNDFTDIEQAKSFAFKNWENYSLVNRKYIWSDFNNSNWKNCNWEQLTFFAVSAEKLNLDNCIVKDSVFVGVDFRGSHFRNTKFMNNKFISCKFDHGFDQSILLTSYSRNQE